MAVNIFSGGRRIAAIVGGLYAVGCIAFAALAEPRASIYYRVIAVGNPYLTDKCKGDDVTEWTSKETPKGDSVSVTICFAKADADDGRRLVPYKEIEGNRVLLHESYSSEVSSYKKAIADRLQLSVEGAAAADKARLDARFENTKNAAMALGFGLAVWWAFVAGLGWVMRGFLGVPKGKDHREAPQSSSAL